MAYRTRIFFTDKQKVDIWDRWQRGESMSSIGRVFDRASSSIFPLLSRTGGIRPPDRKRSRLALTLAEREEKFEEERRLFVDERAAVQARERELVELTHAAETARERADIVIDRMKGVIKTYGGSA